MSELFEFDLDDIDERANDPMPDRTPGMETLEQWVEEQLSKPAAVFFDIETGPLPEEKLRRVYHEKTLEEFSATCDKRWKADTVAAKFEEYKATAWQEFVSKAALSAATGRVLLIGIVSDGKFVGLLDDDERANLSAFWELVESALADKQRIIGHNSNSFDLPFMVRRSWVLDVPVPREIRQGRYWNPLFRDTMEEWSFSGREYIGMNDLGRFFGVGQKTEGFEGKDFSKYWFGTAEERQLAIDYCEQDVRLTAAIAAKMGLV